ncbi:MAG: polyprenyl synthetase family protein [Elusimicrobia bacterium]|nr:polyprenyl synthetase family protein [Elusimicrobiota bacterium]
MEAEKYLSTIAKAVEKRAEILIKKSENAHPLIKKAMSYSLKAGGKRIRPALMCVCYELKGGKFSDILDAACAIEMLHTYSLIHDDLPAMDDDDLRRGKPTNHKVFGEAAAILAGDALLTDAFYHILNGNEKINPVYKSQAAKILAFRAGSNGMVSGQSADLENENFSGKRYSQKKLSKILNYIHSRKTSDLIIASCQMGAALAGDKENFKRLTNFAENLGLCFQITDDILDVVADKKKLGKSGSDAKNKKLTFVSLYGLEKARETAEKSWKKAFISLKNLKGKKESLDTLENIARFVLGRDR